MCIGDLVVSLVKQGDALSQGGEGGDIFLLGFFFGLCAGLALGTDLLGLGLRQLCVGELCEVFGDALLESGADFGSNFVRGLELLVNPVFQIGEEDLCLVILALFVIGHGLLEGILRLVGGDIGHEFGGLAILFRHASFGLFDQRCRLGQHSRPLFASGLGLVGEFFCISLGARPCRLLGHGLCKGSVLDAVEEFLRVAEVFRFQRFAGLVKECLDLLPGMAVSAVVVQALRTLVHRGKSGSPFRSGLRHGIPSHPQDQKREHAARHDASFFCYATHDPVPPLVVENEWL